MEAHIQTPQSLIYLILKYNWIHFMQRSEFKLKARDRVKKEQIVNDAESSISPESIRDALSLVRMSFWQNPANMLTFLEKDTID